MNELRQATGGATARICPRCGTDVIEVFYGPCTDCRAALRGKLGRQTNAAVQLEAAERVHRTPNFVATKD